MQAIQLIMKVGALFAVNKDALRELQSYGEISTISINGPYREGKSFFGNYMYGSYGFKVDNTEEAVTQGIWMRAKPHPKYPERTLLIFDVEGTGTYEETDRAMNVKLYCLSILLSHHFIYNRMKKLDLHMFDELHFAMDIRKLVDTSSVRFPSLSFVLQDCDLVGSESANAYLEKALISDHDSTKFIKDTFPNRICCKLPRPNPDTEILKEIRTFPDERLSDKYIKATTECIENILDKTEHPLMVDGMAVTGQRFAMMIQSAVESINKNDRINVKSYREIWIKEECTKSSEDAVGKYRALMEDCEKNFPVDFKVLKKRHINAKEAAVDIFYKGCVSATDYKYLKKLEDKMEEEFEKYEEENETMKRKKDLDKREEEQNQQQRRLDARWRDEDRKRSEEGSSYFGYVVSAVVGAVGAHFGIPLLI